MPIGRGRGSGGGGGGGATALNDLTDVNIVDLEESAKNGQVLKWDEGDGQWKINEAADGGTTATPEQGRQLRFRVIVGDDVSSGTYTIHLVGDGIDATTAAIQWNDGPAEIVTAVINALDTDMADAPDVSDNAGQIVVINPYDLSQIEVADNDTDGTVTVLVDQHGTLATVGGRGRFFVNIEGEGGFNQVWVNFGTADAPNWIKVDARHYVSNARPQSNRPASFAPVYDHFQSGTYDVDISFSYNGGPVNIPTITVDGADTGADIAEAFLAAINTELGLQPDSTEALGVVVPPREYDEDGIPVNAGFPEILLISQLDQGIYPITFQIDDSNVVTDGGEFSVVIDEGGYGDPAPPGTLWSNTDDNNVWLQVGTSTTVPDWELLIPPTPDTRARGSLNEISPETLDDIPAQTFDIWSGMMSWPALMMSAAIETSPSETPNLERNQFILEGDRGNPSQTTTVISPIYPNRPQSARRAYLNPDFFFSDGSGTPIEKRASLVTRGMASDEIALTFPIDWEDDDTMLLTIFLSDAGAADVDRDAVTADLTGDGWTVNSVTSDLAPGCLIFAYKVRAADTGFTATTLSQNVDWIVMQDALTGVASVTAIPDTAQTNDPNSNRLSRLSETTDGVPGIYRMTHWVGYNPTGTNVLVQGAGVTNVGLWNTYGSDFGNETLKMAGVYPSKPEASAPGNMNFSFLEPLVERGQLGDGGGTDMYFGVVDWIAVPADQGESLFEVGDAVELDIEWAFYEITVEYNNDHQLIWTIERLCPVQEATINYSFLARDGENLLELVMDDALPSLQFERGHIYGVGIAIVPDNGMWTMGTISAKVADQWVSDAIGGQYGIADRFPRRFEVYRDSERIPSGGDATAFGNNHIPWVLYT